MKKGVLALVLVIVAVLAYLVFGDLQAAIITPTSNQNVTGVITLNASVIDTVASGGFNSTRNVTFAFINSTGQAAYTVLVWNDSINDTIFDNATFNTALIADGRYNMTVNASNFSGGAVVNLTGAVNVTIDNTAPTVTLENSTFNTTDTTPDLYFNYTDYASTANCTLLIGGVGYGSNTSVQNRTSTIITANATLTNNRIHTVNVSCTDEVSKVGNSSSITIGVDTTTPTVTLQNTTFNTTDTTPDIYFNYTDFASTANCTLLIGGVGYGSNTSVQNKTSTIITANATLTNNRTHVVNVSCTDSVNQVGISSSITIGVDTTAPRVTLQNSSFNTTDTTPTIYFNYTDFASTASCTLYFGGTAYGTNATTANATSTWITVNSTLSDTSYTVNVNCTDSVSNVGNSSSITVFVDGTNPTVSLAQSSSTTTSMVLAVTTAADATTCSSNRGTVAGSGASQTIEVTGLTAGTSYSFTVTCSDEQSNSGSVTQSFSTSSEGGGGGSGGGSGGGVSSGTVGEVERKVWTSINAGEAAQVDVRNGQLGVTQVSFTVGKNVYGPTIRVKKVEEGSLPSTVGALEGKAYRYVELTETSLKSVLQGDVTVKFKVTKAWLAEQKIASSQVALHRFVDGKWTQLTTTVGEDDGTYVHFTATTPGFSYFAIGQKEGATAVAQETAPAEESTPEVAAGAAETAEEVVAEEGAESGRKVWPLVVIVLVLLVVAALIYFLRQRK